MTWLMRSVRCLRTRTNPWIGHGVAVGTYGNMKTTLNIDDTLMADLKRRGVRQGRTMSENGPIGATPIAYLVPHHCLSPCQFL
jgi:hypothetical protein